MFFFSLISLSLISGCATVSYKNPTNVSNHDLVKSEFLRENWFSDFEQLKQIMSGAYPNLEELATEHKIDLYNLNQETKLRIESAQSDKEELKILQDFVEKFKDGHLKLELKSDLSDTNAETKITNLSRTTSGLVACQKLVDAKPRNLGFRFPMPKELGFDEVKSQGSAFSYTTLSLEKNKIGFIRIASFLDSNYQDLCAQEWEAYRNSIKDTCDDKCQNSFVHELLPNRFLHEIEQATIALKSAKIAALVLDLTNNGGGTDWVGAVIRMFTSKPILCGQFGFIRHQHWAKKFQEDKSDYLEAFKNTKTSSEKKKIQMKLSEAESNIASTNKTCDRSRIWTEKSYSSKCSIVVKKLVADCEPHEEFHYTSAVYEGPLYILVNDGTASASEDLVGRYKDSRAGKIIGSRTHGSGCGFTNGGILHKLSYSGVVVKVPDCARYSRSGINEVLGIVPDVEIPIQDLKSESFTKRLKEWFEIEARNKKW